VVEHRADDASGYSTTRVDAEDQGLERSQAEGRAYGLKLHEEEGAATYASRHPRVSVHGDEDMSRMPSNEVNDEHIVERLGKIFKDKPP
jgi:hypothetical protein